MDMVMNVERGKVIQFLRERRRVRRFLAKSRGGEKPSFFPLREFPTPKRPPTLFGRPVLSVNVVADASAAAALLDSALSAAIVSGVATAILAASAVLAAAALLNSAFIAAFLAAAALLASAFLAAFLAAAALVAAPALLFGTAPFLAFTVRTTPFGSLLLLLLLFSLFS